MLRVAVAAAVIAAGMVGQAFVPPPAAAAVSGDEEQIRQQLVDMFTGLGGLDGLDELADAIPFSNALPTGPDGLGLTDAINRLVSALDPSITSVESALNALDGQTVGGVTLHVEADVTVPSITFTDLRVTATRQIPLDVTTDVVSVSGVDLDLDAGLTLATAGNPLTLAYTAASGLALSSAPDARLTLAAGVDVTTPLAANLGILEAEIVGTNAGGDDVTVDAAYDISWNDPDSTAPFTQAEWKTAPPLELWDVSCDPAASSASMALAFQSDLVPGEQATVTVDEPNLCDGVEIDADNVDLGNLDSFTNMSAFDVISAIAALGTSLRSMQYSTGAVGALQGANPAVPNDMVNGLPFLDRDLPDLVNVSEQIGDFFVGLGLSTPAAPFDLQVDGDDDDNDQIDPDELGNVLLEQGLGSVQDILDALADEIGGGFDLNLGYDVPSEVLTFDYAVSGQTSDVASAPDFAPSFEFGDQLAALGLSNVNAEASASISVDADYSASLGLGLDLRGDSDFGDPSGEPSVTDRLFVRTDGTEVEADAAIAANLSLGAQIGLLSVNLSDSTGVGHSGEVPLLGRAVAADPMVSIDLDAADGTMTLRELADGLSSYEESASTVNGTNELVIDLGGGNSITGTINAAVPNTTLTANATIGSTQLSTLGAASVKVAWPDVTDFDGIVLDTEGTFNDNFFSFNTEDPLELVQQILDSVHAGLDSLDALLSEDLMDQEIPVLGVSAGDLLEQLNEVRDRVDAIASDPSGTLAGLEQDIELAIAEGLGVKGTPALPDSTGLSPADFETALETWVEDDLRPYLEKAWGVANARVQATIDQVLTTLPDAPTTIEELEDAIEQALTDALGLGGIPSPPDPADFTTAGELAENAFNAALESWTTQILQPFLDQINVLGFDYLPGNSPGALVARLDLGICSEKAQALPDFACQKEFPLSQQFELSLADLGVPELGGIIAGEGSGEVALDYFVGANLHFGVELPDVDTSGDLPTVTGTPRPFIEDSSALGAKVAGGFQGQFEGSIGPFEVQIGSTTPIGEVECAGSGDTDDDSDGFGNDGCAPVGGRSEADIPGACDAGDENDDDPTIDDKGTEDTADDEEVFDGVANDGCPAQPNGIDANAGVQLVVSNDLGAGNERVYLEDLDDFFTGMDFDPDTVDGVDCGGGEVVACADFPIYLSVGDDPVEATDFIGALGFETTDFADLAGSTSLVGDPNDILDALEARAESLFWQLLAEGIEQAGAWLDEQLSTASQDVNIPLLGDALDAGADVAGEISKIADEIGDELQSLDAVNAVGIEGEVRTLVATGLTNLGLLKDSDGVDTDTPGEGDVDVETFCGGTTECADGAAVSEITGIEVQVLVGQKAQSETIPFDLGFPGLRIASTVGIQATADWTAALGFGLSSSRGFYLMTEHPDFDVPCSSGQKVSEEGPEDAELIVCAGLDLVGTGLDASTNAPALEGDMAFIPIEVFDAASDPELSLKAELDIQGDGGALTLDNLSSADLVAGVGFFLDVDWKLQTALDFQAEGGSAAIPQLFANVDIEWGPSWDSESEEFTVGAPTFEFVDFGVDLGTFVTKYLKPALDEVTRYTKPLQPVIDVVNGPVPGISQLADLVGAGPITLIDLLENVSDNDLTLLKRLLGLIDFVNATGAFSGAGNIPVILGDYVLDGAALTKPEVLPTKRAETLIGSAPTPTDLFSSFGDSTAANTFETKLAAAKGSEGGFSFPVLAEPSKFFNILLGQDETLVQFDAGPLKAQLSWSQKFGPITIGPIPVSINVSLAAGIEGHFAVGYDTKGLRELVRIVTDDDPGNDGFWTGVGALFSGLYLDDRDATGADVPEIRLFFEGAVGAAVDLVIVSAGVEAGVRSTIDMNLHDGGFVDPIPPENLDGKLRIDEIITFRTNPLCLFDVSGAIEAFIRAFVKIDLFLYSKTFSTTIVNITLLRLNDITAELCEPPEPLLASGPGGGELEKESDGDFAANGVIRLNMGPNADDRNFAEDEEEENFVVRRASASDPDRVTVSAFGYVQTFDGVTKVIADGGTEKDSIKFLEGSEQKEVAGKMTSTTFDFDLPTVVCGGAGDDAILGGIVGDKLGGDGVLGDHNAAEPCGLGEVPTDGADQVGGGRGGDSLWGHGKDDDLTGDDDGDAIKAGGGADKAAGGQGKDQLWGDGDNDNLLGGPESEPGTPTSPEPGAPIVPADGSDDTIHGGTGLDTLEGDWGADTLNGDNDDDIIVGDRGGDTINGGADQDMLFGNEGIDTVHGDGGDDIVLGDQAGDFLFGDAGDDNVVGGDGGDQMNGGAGWDVMIGDNGVVNRAPDPGSSTFNVTPATAPSGLTNQLVELKTVTTEGEAGVPGVDTMSGDGEPDVMYGQELGDMMSGGGGADNMHGNDGTDTMSGDADGDVMFGDDAVDTMYGDDSTGSNGATDGIDTMRGGNDGDTMSGDGSGDVMFGDSGRDTMYGDANTQRAHDGGDTMRGGRDGDLMFGNAGSDTMDGEHDVDRMVGGSDDANSPDGGDTMTGDHAADVMAGDNATIGDDATPPDALDNAQMLVTLLYDGQGAADTMSGGPEKDRLFGQVGNDTIDGDAGDDYAEGNEADDTIRGGDGNDDLVGGSSAREADGLSGVVDADRNGTGRPDGGETLISGGAGLDWIAGDNALFNRNFPIGVPGVEAKLFDVTLATGTAPDPTVAGADTIEGDGGNDIVFGQGGNDVAHGDDGANATGNGAAAGADYVEGNDGDDSIFGEAENDDLVGGGSANDGIIDADRVGNGLRDTGETLISGGSGDDWITGDNSLLTNVRPLPDRAPAHLFDVGLSTGAAPPAAASGNDLLEGDGGDDVIFGQGVGDRIHGDDGPSTAGDGAAAGADYVEGNDGDDTIFGEAENDDLIGGGSANDGIIDALRVGNTLRDVGEALISGGSGNDWITGDNGIVDRNLPSDAPAPIVLFDVELVSAAPVSTLVSGGDLAEGGTGDDRIFGQGNGAQNLSDERDPRDESPAGPGEDNDLDGTTDENWAYASPKGLPAWNGDTLLGNEGADEMEGNHGNDLLLGGDGEDDMLGGGSADDGQIDSDRLNDGANLRDAHDVLHGEGEDDVQAGDNAEIRHDNAVVGRAGFRFVGGESDYDLAERVVEMTASPPGASFGNDFITGNLGDDEQYGQAGNDMMRGDRGDDVQLGDLGQVRTDLIGDGVNELVTSTNFDQAIRPNEPFIDDVRWKTGMLFREARLLSADDTKPGFVGGDDFIVGSDGRDSIHAGPGSDLVAGDGDAPLGSESLHWDPDLEAQGEVTVITDPFDEVIGGETFDGESIDAKVDDGDDEDHIFGGDGADAMWGGRDHDHQYGGHGTDYVDVRPGTNVASGAPIRPHFAFWSRFAGIENYHGHDHLHGGWGQDALQANIAENGPIEGDRLIDAVGAYNVYYLCPATYGDYVSTRDISPSLNGYIQNQAEGDGGYQVKTTGTNGFRELAIVFPSDAKNNSKPVHPDTPGHFVCQSTP